MFYLQPPLSILLQVILICQLKYKFWPDLVHNNYPSVNLEHPFDMAYCVYFCYLFCGPQGNFEEYSIDTLHHMFDHLALDNVLTPLKLKWSFVPEFPNKQHGNKST